MNTSAAYLDTFRENGKRIAEIKATLVDMAQKESDMAYLDSTAEKLILATGGEPAFKKVPGYKWTTCICVNDGFVHCIPKGNFSTGDIVTIDIGMYYKGTTTDTATSFVIGTATEKQEHFLRAGERALRKGIEQAKVGNKIKDIAKAIQRTTEKAGYTVTRNLTGHGLGETMHEDPQIPLYVSNDPSLQVRLQQGMVLAIESMYMDGDYRLKTDKDGWGMRTVDGSLTGMFEDDVILTSEGPEIITRL